jgi:hypothetical protein
MACRISKVEPPMIEPSGIASFNKNEAACGPMRRRDYGGRLGSRG